MEISIPLSLYILLYALQGFYLEAAADAGKEIHTEDGANFVEQAGVYTIF